MELPPKKEYVKVMLNANAPESQNRINPSKLNT